MNEFEETLKEIDQFCLAGSAFRTKIGIDFAAGLSGFDKLVIERNKRKLFGNLTLPFCTVEDLIFYKLFAGRPRDIADLHNLANKYKGKLDGVYLSKLLEDFAEFEREDMKDTFNKIFKT